MHNTGALIGGATGVESMHSLVRGVGGGGGGEDDSGLRCMFHWAREGRRRRGGGPWHSE